MVRSRFSKLQAAYGAARNGTSGHVGSGLLKHFVCNFKVVSTTPCALLIADIYPADVPRGLTEELVAKNNLHPSLCEVSGLPRNVVFCGPSICTLDGPKTWLYWNPLETYWGMPSKAVTAIQGAVKVHMPLYFSSLRVFNMVAGNESQYVYCDSWSGSIVPRNL